MSSKNANQDDPGDEMSRRVKPAGAKCSNGETCCELARVETTCYHSCCRLCLCISVSFGSSQLLNFREGGEKSSSGVIRCYFTAKIPIRKYFRLMNYVTATVFSKRVLQLHSHLNLNSYCLQQEINTHFQDGSHGQT